MIRVPSLSWNAMIRVPTVTANTVYTEARVDCLRGMRHRDFPRTATFSLTIPLKAKPPCFLERDTIFQFMRCGVSLPFHKK